MRQYTNESQTAKLIELGFKKPKSIISAMAYMEDFVSEPCLDCERAYSIGELIEMLPKEFDGELLEIASVTLSYAKWVVRYPYGIIVYKDELVDALYYMVIKLKEEGVI